MNKQVFLAEYHRLIGVTPRAPVYNNRSNCVNCDWGSFMNKSKNVYLGFDSSDIIDSGYITEGFKQTDCYDCDYCAHCELCYQCSVCARMYNCSFCFDCGGMTDCDYCWQCSNCTDCFGCAGLQYKKYCLFNRQLTKTEYQKQQVNKPKYSSPFYGEGFRLRGLLRG